MEGWRKFLNEEPYNDDRGLNPPPNISKVIDLGDRDPMGSDSGIKKLNVKIIKDKEMLSTLDIDTTYPIVSEKNFLIPIKGIPGSTRGADFNQPRGRLAHKGGKHAGWDQWVPVGTPVQAPADGVITRTILAGGRMNSATISFVKKLHALRDSGVDLGITNLPPLSIKTWNQLRKWNKTSGVPNALASLIRKRSDLSIPPNGKGIILLTDPDQHGTRFRFIFSHMDEVTASRGTIKAGQPLGTTGTTGIFDSDPHLHFEILVEGADGLTALPGSLKKNPGSYKIGQIDPIRVIPGLEGAVRLQGTYAGLDGEQPYNDMVEPSEYLPVK